MPGRVDFHTHLHKQPLLPIYALVSSEPLLLQEAASALEKKVLTHAPEFNRDELTASEYPIERLLQAARTLPVLSTHRFASLAQAHRLKARELAELTSYVEKPNPTTVLCISAEKLDQRTALAKKLLQQDCIFSLDPPKPHALGKWLVDRALGKGIMINTDAAQLLADLIGTDLGSLVMALDKLACFAGPHQTVTLEHVEEMVAPTKVHSIFELTDAIGMRDLPRATLLLCNTLGGGENALLVLSMIVRQLRQIAHAQELLPLKLPSAELTRQLGIRPFLLQGLMKQATHYSALEISRALQAAAAADLQIKSTRVDNGIILNRFLISLVGAAPSAAV